MKIESINNLKVKEWMKLKEKKYRDLRNEFLIEGDHLLELAKIHGKIKAIIINFLLFFMFQALIYLRLIFISQRGSLLLRRLNTIR